MIRKNDIYMKTLLAITVFLSLNFYGFSQRTDINQTVKEVYTAIQTKKFDEVIDNFDKTGRERISKEFLKQVYHAILNKEIDYQNPIKIVTTAYDAGTVMTIYRFPFLNSEPGNFFEIAFYEENGLNKVVSLDILNVKMINNLQVKDPIWNNIPNPGQMIVENYKDSEKIQWIKYMDDDYYVVIELNRGNQYRFMETFYSNEDPLMKNIIIYYPSGKIKRIADYYDSRVVGLFREFYENGYLKEIGKYNSDNQKVGKWIYYDDNGEIIKKENFD